MRTSGNAIESSEINVNDNRSIGYILTIRDEKTPKTNVEISFWISCRLDKKGLHSVPWAPAPPIGSKILLKIGKRCKIQLLAPPGALLVKLFRDIPSCYTFRSIRSKLLFRSNMFVCPCGQAVLMVMALFTSSLRVLFSMFVAEISFRLWPEYLSSRMLSPKMQRMQRSIRINDGQLLGLAEKARWKRICNNRVVQRNKNSETPSWIVTTLV